MDDNRSCTCACKSQGASSGEVVEDLAAGPDSSFDVDKAHVAGCLEGIPPLAVGGGGTGGQERDDG